MEFPEQPGRIKKGNTLMKLSERLSKVKPSPTLAISALAGEMKRQGINVVNFAAGEPDFPTPEPVKKAGQVAIENNKTYYTPVVGIPELREAITGKLEKENGLKYSPDQVLVSCGAKHSLFNAVMAFCDAGDEVIVMTPYWVSYPPQLVFFGAVPKYVTTTSSQGFIPDPDDIRKAVTDKTKLIMLNTPSNPTGAVYPDDVMMEIGKIAIENNIAILSDEIYEKIIFDGKKFRSMASYMPELMDHVITINGVSKSYCMTGWRIGYAAGPQEIINGMKKIQSHSTSNPASVSQWAALEAIQNPPEILQSMVKQFSDRRDFVYNKLLENREIQVNKPSGTFYIFFDVSKYYGTSSGKYKINCSVDFCSFMLEKHHIAMVPGSGFGDDNCVRISFATSMENLETGMDSFANGMAELK